jgi:hypothetical protein
MATGDSLESIFRHGLLSTTALLDLFEIQGPEREVIEDCRRPASVPITHPAHGYATIRDQKPISEKKLAKSLRDGLTPAAWYRRLNDKVFFWLTEKRLETLLNAREYRNTRRLILTVDSRPLLEAYREKVVLSPMNSGNTSPFAHPRGADTFLPLDSYPFEDRRKRGLEIVVELGVLGGIPDVKQYVISADEVSEESVRRRVYERP